MRNIALRLRYDGTAYHGWQIQRDQDTVQQQLQQALTKLCGHEGKIVGCGRTDAGVHAERYCANFRSDTRIPIDRLPLAINGQLPEDICVQAAVEAPEDFNSILSCKKKEYTYLIYNSRIKDPFLRSRAWFYPSPLKRDVMREAASMFVGTHDFAAVRSVGTETKTTVRTVYYYEVEGEGPIFRLRVCPTRPLYNMARATAGTAIHASERQLRPGDIPALLEKGDRRLTGPTVPACGLDMTRLWYDGAVGEMMERAGDAM